MILVTGGGGYVGGHLVPTLRAVGQEVRLLRHGESFAALPDGWRLDLAAREQISRLPPLRASALVHLAGLVDIRLQPNPAGAELPPIPGDAPQAPLDRANVLTTAALADYCRANAIPIVFASSQAVYGMPEQTPVDEGAPLRPLEPYAASKVAAEAILRTAATAGLSATVLRFPGAYGGTRRSGSVCAMARAALRDGRIRVVAKFPLPFDILHVDDVVSGILAALGQQASGWRCFNLGSGDPCSLTLLAQAIADGVPGCTVELPRVPQPPILLSTKAAKAALGWSAVPRAERLMQLIGDLRTENVNAA
jgi:nucleoside-diphosphate-sugar epimerase